jgi:hypothetical protein
MMLGRRCTCNTTSRTLTLAALLAVLASVLVLQCSAKVEFTKVLPEGADGHRETIIIKNIDQEAVDLTGWSIIDKASPSANVYWFGGDNAQFKSQPVKWCANFTDLGPEKEFTLKPFNRDRFDSLFEPCGFRFSLGFSGELELRNKQLQAVDRVTWASAKPGMAIYRMGSQYVPFMENQDLKSSIKSAPVLTIFGKALHSTGLLDKLLKEGESIKIEEDSWMAKSLARSGYAKTYYKGPWTVFAPSDDAFRAFMKEMGWFGMTLTEEELLAMPELEEILKYHIVMGQEWSTGVQNATGLVSMKDGAEIAIFHGEDGELFVHDDCVDRPSPDEYGCEMQAEWRKCKEDWVQDEGLFSGRALGYCERSCGRCTCDGGQCGRASIYDIPSSNGVLHVIDKVMYPAPVYEKSDLQWRTKEEIQAELGGTEGIGL